ncbi:hypothetical protein KSU77_13170, partial [Parabacteroides distasonis]|uniref:hypothetical protein n=1 Tax=Parabacteroides distasonis TaxID=823 RepID=UPI001C385388
QRGQSCLAKGVKVAWLFQTAGNTPSCPISIIKPDAEKRFTLFTVPIYKGKAKRCADITQPLHLIPVSYIYEHLSEAMYMPYLI